VRKDDNTVPARVGVDSQWYEQWRKKLLSDPKTRAIYEQEAAKKELWLQLVEARMDAGLTQAQLAKRLGVSQAQVARIEKRGYDSYTLKTLRRYVEALGGAWSVRVEVRQATTVRKPRPAASSR
jgi:DNA-binding XRE family transcriptional regulator